MKHLALTVATLGFANISFACGPYFPTMFAVQEVAHTVLSMPRGSFAFELYRLTGVPAPPRALPKQSVFERDAEELCEALTARGVSPDDVAPVVETYLIMRSAKGHPAPSDIIPREFQLYAEGACYYHQQRWLDALSAWRTLLDLPAQERWYRSTWAAYMCGEVFRKLVLESVPDNQRPAASAGEGKAAMDWFRQTRALAAEGFADSLHLAWSSLGQEARIAFLTEDYLPALLGYLEQYRTPVRGSGPSAKLSLRITAARMVQQPPERLAEYAANSDAAPVLTAYILSHRSRAHLQDAWLSAVADAAPEPSSLHASRLAWLAYNRGDVDLTRRLLKTVSQADPMTRWLEAKVALWDGNTDHAISLLESLADEDTGIYPRPWADVGPWWLDSEERPFVHGELGLLYLARQEYGTALTSFLRGGLWSDVAYVAERVMTAQELEDYLIQRKRDGKAAVPAGEAYGLWYQRHGPDDLDERLAYLLARRWMRAGEGSRAVLWFPEAHQPSARDLNRWLVESEDLERSAEERATARVKAARLVREQGMELLGTELEPDWAVFGGMYAPRDTAQARLQQRPRAPVGDLAPSPDEAGRVQERDIHNSRRFHYRKLAADMMWEAAQTLPDNDLRTAEALYYGGVYLKNKYPQEADRFYKALVNRCRNLPIGQRADQLRWFPSQFP